MIRFKIINAFGFFIIVSMGSIFVLPQWDDDVRGPTVHRRPNRQITVISSPCAERDDRVDD